MQWYCYYSSVATDNSQSTIAMAKSSQESSVATDESLITKSSVVTDELQVADNKIEITDLFAYIKKM